MFDQQLNVTSNPHELFQRKRSSQTRAFLVYLATLTQFKDDYRLDNPGGL
jgi:hypothetical protein